MQYLLLLAVLPLSIFFLTKMIKSEWKWRLTGLSFGIVIAPVSMVLLKFTFVPVVGKLLGLIGLVFNLIHGSLGYFMVVGLGFQEPGVIFTSAELLKINFVNGLVWGMYYGVIGYNFDVKWAEESKEIFEGYKQKVAA